jgi:signal transduction histidine kinase
MSEVEKGINESGDLVVVGLCTAYPLELTQGRVSLENGKIYLVPSHLPVTLKDHMVEIQTGEGELERLKLIFNHTTSAIMALYDAETARFITGSLSYCEMVEAVHGVPAEQLSACTWYQIALVGREEPHIWQTALETRRPVRRSEVHVICRPSGEEKVWDYSLIPVKDAVEPDRIRFMLVSAIDITEPVHMRKELERLNEIKDEFIVMASHELKTPVTTIKSLTHVLQKSCLQQVMQESSVSMLRIINQQIDRLTKLIDDLLNVSKIQAGCLDYELVLVNIDSLVHETVALLQASTSTHFLNVSGATQTTIFGDADRLKQVLVNLITNAIKYSPQANRVDITLSRTHADACIAVRDYGIGISKVAQQHLFERFYRVRGEREQTFPGLGMGLYIAAEIVKRHGGTLTVESEEGKGSTFLLSLPAQEAHP